MVDKSIFNDAHVYIILTIAGLAKRLGETFWKVETDDILFHAKNDFAMPKHCKIRSANHRGVMVYS